MRAFLTAGVIFLGLAGSARAESVTPLGAAQGFAVLGLDTVTLGTDINASNVTITGNVGVSHLGSMQVMAPSKVIGNVYYQDTGSVTGPGTVTGSITQQNLSQAVSDAFNASTGNAALTPTQAVLSQVTSSKTFVGNGGLNVIDITGDINLNNANITLSGGPNDVFVINVGGNLSLTGTASLLVTGVPVANVLYNFTGGTAANRGSFDTHVGDVVNGTMLAPFYDMNLDGTWNGELIGGPLNIGLLSGATVNGDSFNPPVGGPLPAPLPKGSLSVVVLLGIVAFGRKYRLRHAA